jgi:serine/threonine protein kinase
MELRLGEKFKLIKKIGSGAFGEIYKGKANLLFL